MGGSIELSPRVGLVCFAIGAAAVPYGGRLPGGRIPGRILFRLLADLGLSEVASRSLVLRMRRESWLESERTGREARYRLSPAILAAQARIESQLRGRRPEWTGAFSGILHETPEESRAFRDTLRRTAVLLGYATLRPGLLIAASDRWAELTDLLPTPPAGAQLLHIEVRLDAADSRDVSARLWHLDALAGQYRSVLAESQALTAKAREHSPGAAAFRAFAAATLPIYDVTTHDPDLPAELLPADWPGDQLGQALYRANRAYYPLISSYLADVAG